MRSYPPLQSGSGKPARLDGAQIPPDERSGVDVAALRQPVPIRGWQLLVFPPFYEAMGPRHAALTPLSPSKPERPREKAGIASDRAEECTTTFTVRLQIEKVNRYSRSERPRASWAISFVIARCFSVSR